MQFASVACRDTKKIMCSERSVIRRYFSTVGTSLVLATLTLLLIHESDGLNFRSTMKDNDTDSSNDEFGFRNQCPTNMTWHDKGIYGSCRCLPGYLYEWRLHRCFKQYTIGPCSKGQIYIFHRKSGLTQCVRNVCPLKGMVYHKNACHELHASGPPCARDETLEILKTSAVPVCVKISTARRHDIEGPILINPFRCPRNTIKIGKKCLKRFD